MYIDDNFFYTTVLCKYSILFIIIIRRFACKLEQLNKKALEIVFTEDDKMHYILTLYLIIGYGLRQLMRQSPGKG